VGLVELDDGIENPLPKLEAMRTLKTVVDSVALGSPPASQLLQVFARYGQ
jgi:hypothetical protein